jgi:hypothetical protein
MFNTFYRSFYKDQHPVGKYSVKTTCLSFLHLILVCWVTYWAPLELLLMWLNLLSTIGAALNVIESIEHHWSCSSCDWIYWALLELLLMCLNLVTPSYNMHLVGFDDSQTLHGGASHQSSTCCVCSKSHPWWVPLTWPKLRLALG